MATVRKLIVEVVDARNLAPKDGHGTSSPYVILDFYGQRRKTRTVIRDLNPAWNETLEFNLPSDVFDDVLELEMYHDREVEPTTGSNFLGRLRLSSGHFAKKGEEALIYYPLAKRTLFSWIQGYIGLRIYFADEVVPPPAPTAPPIPLPEETKPEQALTPLAAATEPSPEAATTASDSSRPPLDATEPVAEKPGALLEPNPEPPKEPPSDGEKPNEEQRPDPPAEAAPPPETANISSDAADGEKQEMDPGDSNPQQPIRTT